MLVWSDFEPQIVKRFPFLKSGAKKGMPWMWSQWAWVRKMSPAIGSPSCALEQRAAQLADAGAGVEDDQPALVRPELDAGVLPPYRTVLGPGSGWSRAFPRR